MAVGLHRLSPREIDGLATLAQRGGLGQAVALNDCIAEGPDHLMFIQGDSLTLLRDYGELLIAYCEGEVGWVRRENISIDAPLASSSSGPSSPKSSTCPTTPRADSSDRQATDLALSSPVEINLDDDMDITRHTTDMVSKSTGVNTPPALTTAKLPAKDKRVSGPFELDSPFASPSLDDHPLPPVTPIESEQSWPVQPRPTSLEPTADDQKQSGPPPSTTSGAASHSDNKMASRYHWRTGSDMSSRTLSTASSGSGFIGGLVIGKPFSNERKEEYHLRRDSEDTGSRGLGPTSSLSALGVYSQHRGEPDMGGSLTSLRSGNGAGSYNVRTVTHRVGVATSVPQRQSVVVESSRWSDTNWSEANSSEGKPRDTIIEEDEEEAETQEQSQTIQPDGDDLRSFGRDTSGAKTPRQIDADTSSTSRSLDTVGARSLTSSQNPLHDADEGSRWKPEEADVAGNANGDWTRTLHRAKASVITDSPQSSGSSFRLAYDDPSYEVHTPVAPPVAIVRPAPVPPKSAERFATPSALEADSTLGRRPSQPTAAAASPASVDSPVSLERSHTPGTAPVTPALTQETQSRSQLPSPSSLSSSEAAHYALTGQPRADRRRGMMLVGRVGADLSQSKGPVPISFAYGGSPHTTGEVVDQGHMALPQPYNGSTKPQHLGTSGQIGQSTLIPTQNRQSPATEVTRSATMPSDRPGPPSSDGHQGHVVRYNSTPVEAHPQNARYGTPTSSSSSPAPRGENRFNSARAGTPTRQGSSASNTGVSQSSHSSHTTQLSTAQQFAAQYMANQTQSVGHQGVQTSNVQQFPQHSNYSPVNPSPLQGFPPQQLQRNGSLTPPGPPVPKANMRRPSAKTPSPTPGQTPDSGTAKRSARATPSPDGHGPVASPSVTPAPPTGRQRSRSFSAGLAKARAVLSSDNQATAAPPMPSANGNGLPDSRMKFMRMGTQKSFTSTDSSMAEQSSRASETSASDLGDVPRPFASHSRSLSIPRQRVAPVSHRDFADPTINADGMEFELVQPRKTSAPGPPFVDLQLSNHSLLSSDGAGSADTHRAGNDRSPQTGDEPEALLATDEWGFLKNVSPTPAIFHNRRSPMDVRMVELKWLTIIERPLKYKEQPSKRIKRTVIEQGIPSSLRGRVWCWLMSNGTSGRVKGLYKQLVAAPDEVGAADAEIDKDIKEVYSDHSIFSECDSAGQADLRTLLRAYVQFAPNGYRREMAQIGGAFLIHAPVEDAFWLMAGLFNGVLKTYYVKEKGAFRVDLHVFAGILQGSEPKLAKLFHTLGVMPNDYLEHWWTSMFIRTLPWPTVMRLFDAVISEGPRYMLIASLAILSLSKERLLGLPRRRDAVLQYLRNLPQDSLMLPDTFMGACDQVKLRDDDLKKLKSSVKQQLFGR